MATHMEEIIDMRQRKKALYVSLLKKGFDNLSETEIQILHNLAMDDDIQLLLKNGDTLK